MLPDISGGNVLYLTDGAVTYATYTCDDQYDLYGSQSRTCQADHTWGGEEPSCSKYNHFAETSSTWYILLVTSSMLRVANGLVFQAFHSSSAVLIVEVYLAIICCISGGIQ